jgi:hypothetical protein
MVAIILYILSVLFGSDRPTLSNDEQNIKEEEEDDIVKLLEKINDFYAESRCVDSESNETGDCQDIYLLTQNGRNTKQNEELLDYDRYVADVADNVLESDSSILNESIDAEEQNNNEFEIITGETETTHFEDEVQKIKIDIDIKKQIIEQAADSLLLNEDIISNFVENINFKDEVQKLNDSNLEENSFLNENKMSDFVVNKEHLSTEDVIAECEIKAINFLCENIAKKEDALYLNDGSINDFVINEESFTDETVPSKLEDQIEKLDDIKYQFCEQKSFLNESNIVYFFAKENQVFEDLTNKIEPVNFENEIQKLPDDQMLEQDLKNSSFSNKNGISNSVNNKKECENLIEPTNIEQDVQKLIIVDDINEIIIYPKSLKLVNKEVTFFELEKEETSKSLDTKSQENVMHYAEEALYVSNDDLKKKFKNYVELKPTSEVKTKLKDIKSLKGSDMYKLSKNGKLGFKVFYLSSTDHKNLINFLIQEESYLYALQRETSDTMDYRLGYPVCNIVYKKRKTNLIVLTPT